VNEQTSRTNLSSNDNSSEAAVTVKRRAMTNGDILGGMFFEHKVETRWVGNDKARQRVLRLIDERLATAQVQTDPGQKLLKLDGLLKDIDYLVDSTKLGMKRSEASTWLATFSAVTLGSIILSVVGVALHIPLLVFTVPFALCGPMIANTHSQGARDHLVEKTKGFLKTLKAQKLKTAVLRKRLFKADIAPNCAGLTQTAVAAIPSLQNQAEAVFDRQTEATKLSIAHGLITSPNKGFRL